MEFESRVAKRSVVNKLSAVYSDDNAIVINFFASQSRFQ